MEAYKWDAVVTGAHHTQRKENGFMNLIPKPNGAAEFTDGSYTLQNKGISIGTGTFSEKSVQAFLERTGLRQESKSNGNDILLQREVSYGTEEYGLSVSKNGIAIKAADERAVINALTTLYQLISKGGEIPCCQIHDKPRYSHRGLLVDCARHFFPVPEIKRVIEQMALVKMNVFHWHLTDDQGWRIESKKFPKLHKQHGKEYYSQKEIRDIVAFAASRGIEVIPEIDLPGHVSALLAAYPQYSCSGKEVKVATCGGIYPVILCAGNNLTYKLLEELLDEICPLFTSNKFHIGGDEAPKKEWKKCSCCQQKIKKEGLYNETELQGYFSNRLVEMLAKRGKEAVCWNESLEAANLNTNVTVQYWTVGGAEHMKQFIGNGGKFIYSDMFNYYLDYPHAMTSLLRLYEGTLDIGGTDYADCPSLSGVEVCVWSEHLPDAGALQKRLFPRLYAAAELMWSEKRDYDSFVQRLRGFLEAYHPSDMEFVPESGWNPQGDERRKEAFGYIASLNAAIPPEIMAETVEASAPTEEFRKRFVQKFFDPSDLSLLAQMMPAND